MQSYLPTVCYATVALLLFLCHVLWQRRTSSTSRPAPEPAGGRPFIGHLLMVFAPNVLPHRILGELADKYGSAFMVRLGLHKVLVVSSSEVAKECFITNDRAFATRSSSVAVKIMGYNYALFGFGPYGPYWREARKIAVAELLSSHRLELLKRVRMSEVDTSINDLYKFWQNSRSNGHESVSVEMKQWFGHLTVNVIVKMIAGKRYSSDNLVDCEGIRLQKAIQEFFRLLGCFVLADAIPCLGWLDFHGHVKAMKRNAKQLDDILQGWLEEHKQSKGAEDFMYVLLSILEGAQFLDYDADTVNKAICLNMILGGTDTTIVTLTWAFSLLLNNRHIMKKAQDEIDAITGKERQVEESDIEKFVFLRAIVKETMRLYPAAPLGPQREALEDCTVAGYRIPAGTGLMANVSKIQRDPRLWSNPDEFKPERFLTTQANVDFRSPNLELIPFGWGRRSCPGLSFGLQAVHLTLACLLQAFDCETPLNASVDMTESAGFTNRKETPLHVLITPRLSANLHYGYFRL